MQRLFQNTKRLISMCVLTLLLVTSALTISPAPAMAGDLVIVKCERDSNCGNLAAFAAGTALGSVVTLIATGDTATLAAVGSVATVTTGSMAALGSALAAPVVVPLAATAALGYIGYEVWQAQQHTQTKSSK